jgi:hypothetical protein
MAVYVDPMRSWGGAGKFRWKESCHMYADTVDELHAMAAKIGLKREWFQDDQRLPHYDLHQARRTKALKHGAYTHTRGEMVSFMRALKLERELAALLQENGCKGMAEFSTGELLNGVTTETINGALYGSVPAVAMNGNPRPRRDV